MDIHAIEQLHLTPRSSQELQELRSRWLNKWERKARNVLENYEQ